MANLLHGNLINNPGRQGVLDALQVDILPDWMDECVHAWNQNVFISFSNVFHEYAKIDSNSKCLMNS